MKTKDSEGFLQTNQKHKFEACFLRGQVLSNELNLEFYWSLRILRIFLLFSKGVMIG